MSMARLRVALLSLFLLPVAVGAISQSAAQLLEGCSPAYPLSRKKQCDLRVYHVVHWESRMGESLHTLAMPSMMQRLRVHGRVMVRVAVIFFLNASRVARRRL
jgi:hypothetical protein